MRQTWSKLLFAHWSIDSDLLKDLVPSDLVLDVFGGQAYLGIVPFKMTDVTLTGMPAVPGLSNFLELNVRTYVKHNDKPGVYFFSLDAANRIAVELARSWYSLPYFNAHMKLNDQNGQIEYQSTRTDKRGKGADLHVKYHPSGAPFKATAGSLEHWLTERYCLYTKRQGKLYRAEIHHAQWPLQPAKAEFIINSMLAQVGVIPVGDAPLLHYAEKVDMVAWPILPV